MRDLYPSDVAVLLKYLERKQQGGYVYIPLDDAPDVHYSVVGISGKHYLRVPRLAYDEYQDIWRTERIVAATIVSSLKSREKDIEKFLPKPPWQKVIDEYKLKKAKEHAERHGLKVPGVIV